MSWRELNVNLFPMHLIHCLGVLMGIRDLMVAMKERCFNGDILCENNKAYQRAITGYQGT